MKSHSASFFRNRKFEDKKIIAQVEKTFIRKRGHVFIMPPPRSKVILLVSGGLDSSLIWSLLMDKYKLKVYPLFLNKGEKRKTSEERSVDFFAKYYEEKYPRLFIKPVKQTVYLPQKEIIEELKTPYNELSGYKPQKDFSPSTTSNIFLGSPGLVPFYALFFGRYLELKNSENIHTIFSSVLLGDGTVCPSQTLTSLRLINLAMCTFTNDYSWQFTSPCIEPNMERTLQKKDLIAWGNQKNIPIEKSWSCYKGLRFHCGTCQACQARKTAFKEAAVVDKTRYMKPHIFQLLIVVFTKTKRVTRKVAKVFLRSFQHRNADVRQ